MIILHFHLQPQFKNELFHIYFTVNPLLRVRGRGGTYLFITHFRWRFRRLIIKKMVSVLHKELECNVKKLKYKKLEVMQSGHATEDKKQIRTSSW